MVKDNLVINCWESAVDLALFRITWWSTAGKELASWFCLGLPGGHLLGKSWSLGFVYDHLVVFCWERAGPLALFRIT